MSEIKITIVSRAAGLSQRILEVNDGLSKWLISQGDDYDSERDMLRLMTYKKEKDSYLFQYEIIKGSWDSNERRKRVQEWMVIPITNQGAILAAGC
jgi:hypothetical protein